MKRLLLILVALLCVGTVQPANKKPKPSQQVQQEDVPPPPPAEEEIPGPPAEEPEGVIPPPPAEEVTEVVVQAPEPLPYEVPFQVPPKPGRKPDAPNYEPGSVIIADVEDQRQVLIQPKAAVLLAPEIRKLEQVKAPYNYEVIEFFGRVVNELSNIPQQISQEERRDVQEGLIEGLLSFAGLSFNTVVEAFQLAEIWAPNIAPVFRDVVPLVCIQHGKQCMDTLLSPDFSHVPLGFPQGVHANPRVIMVFDHSVGQKEAENILRSRRSNVIKEADGQSIDLRVRDPNGDDVGNVYRWYKSGHTSWIARRQHFRKWGMMGGSAMATFRAGDYKLSIPYDGRITMQGLYPRPSGADINKYVIYLSNVVVVFGKKHDLTTASDVSFVKEIKLSHPVTAMAWYDDSYTIVAQEGSLALTMFGATGENVQTLYAASNPPGTIRDMQVTVDKQINLLIEHDQAYALYKAIILPHGLTAYQLFIFDIINSLNKSERGKALVNRSRALIAAQFNGLPALQSLLFSGLKDLVEREQQQAETKGQEEKKRAAQEVEGLEDEPELSQEEKKRQAATPVKEVLGLDED